MVTAISTRCRCFGGELIDAECTNLERFGTEKFLQLQTQTATLQLTYLYLKP